MVNISFQMYDQIATAEIVLVNTGRVGFDFTAVGMDPGMAVRPKPGVPIMIPHTVSKLLETCRIHTFASLRVFITSQVWESNTILQTLE